MRAVRLGPLLGPVALIGRQLGLRTDDGRLLAMVTDTGEVVAEHTLVAPGEASILDAHYGGPRPAPRRAVRPKTVAEKQFCALGPVAEAFITGAAAAGAGTPQPREAGDALVLDLPVVPVRSLADYAIGASRTGGAR